MLVSLFGTAPTAAQNGSPVPAEAALTVSTHITPADASGTFTVRVLDEAAAEALSAALLGSLSSGFGALSGETFDPSPLLEGLPTVEVAAGATVPLPGLTAGTVILLLDEPASGFSLTGAGCLDASGMSVGQTELMGATDTIALGAAAVTVELGDDASVDCAFEFAAPGAIEVTPRSDDPAAPAAFTFRVLDPAMVEAMTAASSSPFGFGGFPAPDLATVLASLPAVELPTGTATALPAGSPGPYLVALDEPGWTVKAARCLAAVAPEPAASAAPIDLAGDPSAVGGSLETDPAVERPELAVEVISQSDPATGSVSFELDPGATARCTFDIVPAEAALTVSTHITPADASGTFTVRVLDEAAAEALSAALLGSLSSGFGALSGETFDPSPLLEGLPTVEVAAGATVPLPGLTAGTVILLLDEPASGFSLTGAGCLDASGMSVGQTELMGATDTIALGAAAVTVELGDDASVDCAFEFAAPGAIEVTPRSDDPAAPAAFTFRVLDPAMVEAMTAASSSPFGFGGFPAPDLATVLASLPAVELPTGTATALPAGSPGPYLVALDEPGWTVKAARCLAAVAPEPAASAAPIDLAGDPSAVGGSLETDPAVERPELAVEVISQSDPATGSVSFELDPGATARCTFDIVPAEAALTVSTHITPADASGTFTVRVLDEAAAEALSAALLGSLSSGFGALSGETFDPSPLLEGLPTVEVAAGATVPLPGLTAGTVILLLDEPASGFSLTGAGCLDASGMSVGQTELMGATDTIALGAAAVTVELGDDASVDCAFEFAAPGAIEVTPRSDDPAAPAAFTFRVLDPAMVEAMTAASSSPFGFGGFPAPDLATVLASLPAVELPTGTATALPAGSPGPYLVALDEPGWTVKAARCLAAVAPEPAASAAPIDLAGDPSAVGGSLETDPAVERPELAVEVISQSDPATGSVSFELDPGATARCTFDIVPAEAAGALGSSTSSDQDGEVGKAAASPTPTPATDVPFPPKAGRWRVVNESARFSCGGIGSDLPRTTDQGRIQVRGNGRRIIASGSGIGDGGRVVLDQVDGEPGTYRTTVRFKASGVTMPLNVALIVTQPERFTGTLRLDAMVAGARCTMTRDFSGRFIGE